MKTTKKKKDITTDTPLAVGERNKHISTLTELNKELDTLDDDLEAHCIAHQ